MKPEDPLHPTQLPHAIRNTLLNPQSRGISPSAVLQHVLPLHSAHTRPQRSGTASPLLHPRQNHDDPQHLSAPPTGHGRSVSNGYNLPTGYTPFLESIKHDTNPKDRDGSGIGNGITPMRLPSALTTEDFTRAVAVATVSALRHQGSIIGHVGGHGKKERVDGGVKEEEEEGGGHEAPSWNRGVSAGVLLGCTVLYAIIAGKSLHGW
jgi:Ca2+:H+ antiporter